MGLMNAFATDAYGNTLTFPVNTMFHARRGPPPL